MVADPEAGAGVAEQPAGAVDDAVEAAVADRAADRAGAGDEGGAVELGGAGGEEGEQVAARRRPAPGRRAARCRAAPRSWKPTAGARVGEQHQLDRRGGAGERRGSGERLRDRGAHRGDARGDAARRSGCRRRSARSRGSGRSRRPRRRAWRCLRHRPRETHASLPPLQQRTGPYSETRSQAKAPEEETGSHMAGTDRSARGARRPRRCIGRAQQDPLPLGRSAGSQPACRVGRAGGPAASCSSSASNELAERAGTSAATVTRFCRQIGYTGYIALRMSIATERRPQLVRPADQVDIGRAFGPDDTAEDVRSTLLGRHDPLAAGDRGVDRPRAAAPPRGGADRTAGTSTSTASAAAPSPRRRWRRGSTGSASTATCGRRCTPASPARCCRPRTASPSATRTPAAPPRRSRCCGGGPAGGLTVAITNDPTSPLAERADARASDRRVRAVPAARRPRRLLLPVYVGDLLYVLTAQVDFERTSRHLAASALAVAPHRRPRRRPADPPRTAARAPTPRPRPRPEEPRMTDVHDRRRPRLRRGGAQPARARSRRSPADGGFDAAIDLIDDASRHGGVAYAFGTGHSEAFAMEIAGRAGGLMPTKKVALRDLALRRRPAGVRAEGRARSSGTRTWPTSCSRSPRSARTTSC